MPKSISDDVYSIMKRAYKNNPKRPGTKVNDEDQTVVNMTRSYRW